jgi:hypothetical protein
MHAPLDSGGQPSRTAPWSRRWSALRRRNHPVLRRAHFARGSASSLPESPSAIDLHSVYLLSDHVLH